MVPQMTSSQSSGRKTWCSPSEAPSAPLLRRGVNSESVKPPIAWAQPLLINRRREPPIHFFASSSSLHLASFAVRLSSFSKPFLFSSLFLFKPPPSFSIMSGPQDSGVDNKSHPIYVSSSFESEALAAMLESLVMVEGDSSWPPALPSRAQERYEWVSEEVLTYRSSVSRSDVALLVVDGGWLRKSYLNKFDLMLCSSAEHVCHAAREGEGDFIFMYETTFKDLGVVLPFDCFAAGVLRMLEVAPFQLYPNG
ncbi:hypothetical protein CR513_59746, partial [Mucuna pruriens]